MLLDRRELLEVALDARGELVRSPFREQPRSLLAGTRALLPRSQSGALADPRPLGAATAITAAASKPMKSQLTMRF